MAISWSRAAALALVFAVAICAQAANQSAPNPAQQQRIRELTESLMAPCCWAEPVSVHRSEIAMQMRMEIEQFVAQGKTDREILDHYKGIYGARILVEPEGASRLWVYLIPTLASLAGLGLVLLAIRRLLSNAPADQPAH
jgi:cytochrome c-type biogenesis protein CcmH/NrfF